MKVIQNRIYKIIHFDFKLKMIITEEIEYPRVEGADAQFRQLPEEAEDALEVASEMRSKNAKSRTH